MKKNLNAFSKIFGVEFKDYLRIAIDDDEFAIVYADGNGVCAVKLNDEIVNGKVPLYEISNVQVAKRQLGKKARYENRLNAKQLKNGDCLGFVEAN